MPRRDARRLAGADRGNDAADPDRGAATHGTSRNRDHPRMNAGIIAAGLGERLRNRGITTPKPLLEVGGRPLIARAIATAIGAGATHVACIVNAETDRVRHVLETTDWGVPLTVVQRTTASSAESFLALRPYLETAPFLLLTVD